MYVQSSPGWNQRGFTLFALLLIQLIQLICMMLRLAACHAQQTNLYTAQECWLNGGDSSLHHRNAWNSHLWPSACIVLLAIYQPGLW